MNDTLGNDDLGIEVVLGLIAAVVLFSIGLGFAVDFILGL